VGRGSSYCEAGDKRGQTDVFIDIAVRPSEQAAAAALCPYPVPALRPARGCCFPTPPISAARFGLAN